MIVRLAILVALLCAACSSLRDDPGLDGTALCVTWQDSVAAVLAERCVACHGETDPAGDYAVTDYLATLGSGSDEIANAIAGDRDSALLRYLDPAGADDVHAPLTDVYPLVSDWVVRCQLAYVRSRVHRPGILDPESSDFHGKLIARVAYDFDGCATCHGSDDSGGPAHAPCTTCHPQGPSACQTCHGDGPRSGSHQAHAGLTGNAGNGSEAMRDCALCHRVPESYRDPGHVLLAVPPGARPVVDGPPAEVRFSGLAAQTAGAAYDPATGSCRTVYCHGAGLDDSNATLTTPTWGAGSDQAACGTCHGQPPSSHADDRCPACHSRVVDAGGFVAAALHVDGTVEVGRGTGTCSDCHGSAATAAPPPALDGTLTDSALAVGAHLSHVTAAHRLRGPLACSDCHREPAELASPGHIDSPGPAEVFPGPGPFPGLGSAGGAQPAWDRASGRCSDVYCHGGGTTRLGQDSAPGLVRAPTWTVVGQGQAACGTCHGVPPADGLHAPSLTVRDCITCHPGTVDAFGNILVTQGPFGLSSEHMDGEFDVF